MDALFWFLMGCAPTLAVCLLAARYRRQPAAGGATTQLHTTLRPSAAEVIEPRRYLISDPRSLEDLSESLGAELAGLASGVEGQAQLLCETLGHPNEIAERAEQLWESVRRLRFFCEKMQSFSKVAELDLEPTNVRMLLAALALEIEDYSSGYLQVGLQVAPSLPFATANADALRIAVLFLIEGVIELEPDANSLLLQARSHENGEDGELSVRIDIEAVLDEGSHQAEQPPPLIQYSYLAARNLLAAQGATFTLDHSPGLNAIASITLTATGQPTNNWAEPDQTVTENGEDRVAPVLDSPDPDSPDPGTQDPGTLATHQFGGVLIMEGNPTIRDLLARELAKTRRNVIACADGIAARTLFEATPERFEVLILERESRRLRGEELARLALRHQAQLRIIMIHPGPGVATAADLAAFENLTILHKPFGLMELRSCLSDVLGTCASRPESLASEPA